MTDPVNLPDHAADFVRQPIRSLLFIEIDFYFDVDVGPRHDPMIR
jgi:hypothetical protein